MKCCAGAPNKALWLFLVLWAVPAGVAVGESQQALQPGLVWVMFNSSDFTRPAGMGVAPQVNHDTTHNDYSMIWLGLLKAATTGRITIEADTDDRLRLKIGDKWVIDGLDSKGTFQGKKGQLLPVWLEYCHSGDRAFIRLYWSWAGKGRELVPASGFLHSESDVRLAQDLKEMKRTPQEEKSSIYVPQSLSPTPGAKARKPVPIHPGPHLLIDDYLIESSRNLTRKVNQPKRDPSIPNPLVTGKQDRCFQPYFTVLRNPKTSRFRIWYGASTTEKHMSRSHIGYMESQDGIHWIRPARMLKDPATIQFGCEVIDEGPDCLEPSKRYKFSWWFKGGLHIATSPDGLNFKPLVEWVVLHHNHDINNISWDPLRKCYVATVSTVTTGDKWSGSRRVTMQSFSKDLLHWRIPWYVLTPDDSIDEGETQFYAMSGFIVRGPLKIGMVKILRDDLKADEPPLVAPDAYGIGYTTLAWTRDGEHWTRDRKVFFDRNPEPQTWDRAHAWIDEQLSVGDEVYLYYGGYKQGHKVNRFEERQIGLVKMPLDRYVAHAAEGRAPGRLLTVPLLLDDRPGCLAVNADSSAGKLRIQVRDASDNTAIPGLSFDDCQPITADGLSLEVCWESEEQTLRKLASLANKAIKLEFELTNARVFAFDFVTPRP